MLLNLFLFFLMSVCARAQLGTPCEADCEKAWNQATGSVFDSRKRCDSARDYKNCLEKECQRVDVPVSLQIEEGLHCNMPRLIPGGQSSCEYAQTLCYASWSREEMTVYSGEERCVVAQQFRDCLVATMAELRCRDFGVHQHQVLKELQVNCIGDDDSECVQREDECRDAYEKAGSSTKDETCHRARQYRQCLAEMARTIDCKEFVPFPEIIDTEEKDNCPDYSPRPTCKELESKCRSQWTLVSGPTLPIELRCKHAKKWVGCLERIILDGGCPGGYTVAVRARVEVILSCHIAHKCGEERSRCWTVFELRRKYLRDKRAMCKQVQDAKSCYQKLKKDNVCPSKEDDAGELIKAEEFWCKERLREQRCDAGKKACRQEFRQRRRDDSTPCKAAQNWQACFVEVVSREDCLDTTPPSEINTAIASSCFAHATPTQADVADTCLDKRDACKIEHYFTDLSEDVCVRAHRWRVCLEGIPCLTPAFYPFNLNQIEAENHCGA